MPGGLAPTSPAGKMAASERESVPSGECLMSHANMRAAWTVEDLQADPGWIFTLDERGSRHLADLMHKVADPDRSLFDYRRAEFDLGPAWPTIAAAMREVRDGTGFAVLRGLPRTGLTEAEFQLLTWAIGLHTGVARPQGKASHFISAVRDAGTVYRSSGGRGYSSNADLDFHTDGADVVLLTCYNVAKSGGESWVSSSVTAHEVMRRERLEPADGAPPPVHFTCHPAPGPAAG